MVSEDKTKRGRNRAIHPLRDTCNTHLLTRAQALAPTLAHDSRTQPTSHTSFPCRHRQDYGWGVDVVRKQERAARAAEAGDVVVEVTKPLGVVLEEDKYGVV